MKHSQQNQSRVQRQRAFSLVELLCVLLVVVILVVAAIVALSRARRSVLKQYDGMQIRGVHQSMVTWAGQSQDTYPLVSAIDLKDTIPGIDSSTDRSEARKKDLPRWIMSMLMYNGSFGPQLLRGLTEVNPAFRVDDEYEYNNPTAVEFAKRKDAVLDPAFACYPDEPGGDAPIRRANGRAPAPGCSYAFQTFVGLRGSMWTCNFKASEAVAGNRGPWYKLDSAGSWVLDPTDRRGKTQTPANRSNTLLLYGNGGTWQGNVVRNDNSVAFESRPDPENLEIKYAAAVSKLGVPKYDNLFANEDDAGDGKTYSCDDDRITPANFDKRKNNYLRCWGGDGTGSNLTIDPVTKQITSIIDFWYD